MRKQPARRRTLLLRLPLLLVPWFILFLAGCGELFHQAVDSEGQNRSWSPAQYVGSQPGDISELSLAANRSGSAVLFWEKNPVGYYDLYACHFSLEGGWDSFTAIETGTEIAESLRAALNDRGNVALLWHRDDGAGNYQKWALVRRSDGTWEPLHPLGIDTTTYGAAVMDGEGFATILTVVGGRLYSERCLPGGGWDGSVVLDDAGGTCLEVAAAVDGFGTVTAAWIQDIGPETNLYAKIRSQSVGWSYPSVPPQESLGWDCTSPRIAASRKGAWMLVWIALNGVIGESFAKPFSTNPFQWSPADTAIDTLPASASSPAVAVAGDGNAMAVWLQNDGFWDRIVAAHYSKEQGSWSPPVIINPDGAPANMPKVAMDEDGNAVAVWIQDSAGWDSIWANRYTPRSGWGQPVLLENIDAFNAKGPRVALFPGGQALAVWSQYAGAADAYLMYSVLR